MSEISALKFTLKMVNLIKLRRSLFPERVFSWLPKIYVVRLYTVKQWSVMRNVEHLVAMDHPKLFIDYIRLFSKSFE